MGALCSVISRSSGSGLRIPHEPFLDSRHGPDDDGRDGPLGDFQIFPQADSRGFRRRTLLFLSPLWIRYSATENVFYDPGILLSLTAAWLVLRWFDDRALWTIGLAGLCAGLAIWCTAMTACLLVPPASVLAWACRRRPAHLGVAAVGFLLGLSPWIAFFAMRGRSALRVFHTSQSHWTVFKDSVVQLIPVSLGSGTSDSSVLIGWSVFLGSAVCLAVFLARRHFELACCAASIVLWPFLVVAAGVAVVPAAYRYAFLIQPPSRFSSATWRRWPD